MLDLCLIRIDGRPAAFAYNYHHQGYVFGLRSGWDPQFADAGLGTYLYATALEGSCRLGDRLYDLGPNYYQAKERWINRIARTVHLRHYPLLSPRAQLLRMKHWLTEEQTTPSATV
jgi:CelD/BcsL family acetyltransferase involved in cellulose biosynthesis